MPIPYKEWTSKKLEVIRGSIGGDTYLLDGKALCYCFVKPHYNAVRLMTGRITREYTEITEELVLPRVKEGLLRIDTSECQHNFSWEDKPAVKRDYGWLGCKVWDANDDYVGSIGTRCGQPAGFATEHLGYGRCKFHGGSGIEGRMLAQEDPTTSSHLRYQVQNRIGKFLDDPAPLDLTREIATQRALLEMLIEYVLNRGDVEFLMSRVPALVELVDKIGNMANRAAVIEKRYAMTVAQVRYVEAVFVDIIHSYIPNPKVREQIAAELQHRLGSGARETSLATQSAYLVSEVEK